MSRLEARTGIRLEEAAAVSFPTGVANGDGERRSPSGIRSENSASVMAKGAGSIRTSSGRARASPVGAAAGDRNPKKRLPWSATETANAPEARSQTESMFTASMKQGRARHGPDSHVRSVSYWAISRQLMRLPVGAGASNGIGGEVPVASENRRS